MNSTITQKNNKTISVLGCGWYGLELAKALINQGYLVKGSSTTPEKLEMLSTYNIEPFLVNIQKDEEKFNPSFFKSDLLFVCIPPKRNAAEQADFYYKIERIINAVKENRVKQLVFISSTAVYGDTNAELTELNTPQPETDSGKAMLKVESLLKNQNDFTSTIIRFGGLVGPKRHPGRFFAGKENIPNGKAPINLIHLDDCIGISLAILKNEAFGYTFNACSPDHPSKQDFYTVATINAQLTPPLFIDELLNWKIVSSVHFPVLNYNYLVTNWIKWFEKDNPN
ncbi:NAD(P)H-binding protein [Pedobacter nyackensis]|uniref:NAD(P)H-binding protein n=1 Tax=Pedobacter nyackensis TaxID=475255 RepID=UPI00292DCA11|nr:NAD(P)H-binding protein [Pedobacter nyackensis]